MSPGIRTGAPDRETAFRQCLNAIREELGPDGVGVGYHELSQVIFSLRRKHRLLVETLEELERQEKGRGMLGVSDNIRIILDATAMSAVDGERREAQQLLRDMGFVEE